MDILYIIIPAYNEEENIESIIKDWYPIIEKHNGSMHSRLVIIDDGSKDRTYQIASKCADKLPLLTILTKPNGGHGSAVLFGYRYAIQSHAQYIFQTDSDGQTSPDEFEQFWAARQGYGAVIGDRNDRKDGVMRKLIEKVLLFILKLIFHVKMPDSNSPYRLMKTEIVEKYISFLPKDYNLPNVMLTTFFIYYKEKVTFIQISFKAREKGTNSINLGKIIKIGWKALGDFMFFRKEMVRVNEGVREKK